MKKLLSIAILLLAFLQSNAQKKQDPNIQTMDTLNQIGIMMYESGEYVNAIAYFNKALELSIDIFGEKDQHTAQILMNMSYSLFQLGEDSTALIFSAKAYESFEKYSPGYFDAIHSIIIIEEILGDYNTALEWVLFFLQTKEEIRKNKDEEYAEMLKEAGDLYSKTGRSNDAMPYYSASIELLKKLYGASSENFIKKIDDISVSCIEADNYHGAVFYGEQALEAAKKKNGKKQVMYIVEVEILALAYAGAGDCSNAKIYASQAAEIEEKYFSNMTHATYTLILERLGNCYKADNDYVNALEYYTRAATNYIKAGKAKTTEYANLESNISTVYLNLNDCDKALEHRTSATKIYGETFGKDNILYAFSLTQTGLCYHTKGDYSKAIEYYQQGLDIYKKNTEADNPMYNPIYSEVLDEIGSSYISMGKYEEAIKYLLQALDFADESMSQNVTVLTHLGHAYLCLGQFETGYLYMDKALKIAEKNNGKSLQYAIVLSNMADIYITIGDYDNFTKCTLQAMEIISTLPNEHYKVYAGLLSQYTDFCCIHNNYEEAFKYGIQTVDIIEKIYGRKHPEYASALSNLGVIYNELGNYQKALSAHEQALNILKNTVGETDIRYANVLNNKGASLFRTKEYDLALNCFLKALDIKKKALGNTNPALIPEINNIGYLLLLNGNYDKANEYNEYQKNIAEGNYGKKHLEYIHAIYNIGTTSLRKLIIGDVENNKADAEMDIALRYITEAMKITKELFGEDNTDYAEGLLLLGMAYKYKHDYATSSKYYIQAFGILKEDLKKKFSFMTAQEREAFWTDNADDFKLMLEDASMLPSNKEIAASSYDVELITKGLLLTSEIEFNKLIAESGDASLVSEYNDMQTMNHLLNIELEKPIAERNINCDSLENEIQKLERHIIENSRDYGDFTKSITINWNDVRNSLKSRDVAIEFTSYGNSPDSTKYAAIILTRNMDAPVFVPLADQKDIEKIQRGVSSSKADTPNDDDNRGAVSVSVKRQGIYESNELYRLLWKPLEKYFPANPRIYFAPSGMLHQIAIEYAPVDEGKLISDKYEIYRVSSTRFLAMDYTPNPLKNSVLYGGILYDSDTTTMKQESERYYTRSVSYTTFAEFNKDEDRGSVNFLPGTKTEVDNIINTLKKGKIATTLYEGSQANEESFKALSGKDISVLHIATHGFFLPTDKKLQGDQSLIQSGLMLSGANYAWQNLPIPEGIEDGILTAKEISFMDLRKTDLVVLSACQTALGEITGEGVFGLQRGFKKAGARTIIMSLWPVDDNATLLMMTEFYNNLTKGMTKREAFNAAQSVVKKTKGFENPRYWAAFIMLDGNEK